MSPIKIWWVKEIATYGQYGVDLFFVLSGWLIGGLYWRERRAFLFQSFFKQFFATG